MEFLDKLDLISSSAFRLILSFCLDARSLTLNVSCKGDQTCVNLSIIAEKNHASKVSFKRLFALMREELRIRARSCDIQEVVTIERMIQARNVKLDQQRLWGSGSTGAAAAGARLGQLLRGSGRG